ncbi:MAG: DegT/DnrJ/EryC1/StrS family aminotransferase [Pirellulales bacterium]
MIPLCDVSTQHALLKQEIDQAVQDVVANGQYILGPQVRAFEREISDYCRCRYAVGVGNGTDALHLALRALRIGPGDEVITSPFTFIATTEAIGLVGAKPVFVDIDPHTLNIDPARIEQAITSRTQAILPVHLYGQPCEMDAIMDIAQRHGLFVVEDCAQALGATYRDRQVGTFGDAGCFSFFPSKNLGCIGDGGMVVTNREDIFQRVEMLRRHGGRIKYHHDELGLNSRLDELQAAILRVKLPHLDDWNQRRRQCAYHYNARLADQPAIDCPAELGAAGPEVFPTASNRLLRAVYHQYTIRSNDRDAISANLRQAGVRSAVYYPQPLHLQKVHAELNYAPGDFPVAEDAARKCLSLPIYPELLGELQESVLLALTQNMNEGFLNKTA